MLQRLLKYRPSTASRECMPDQDIISEGMGHTYVPSFTSATSSDLMVVGLLALTQLPVLWLTPFGKLAVVQTSNSVFTPNWTRRCPTLAPFPIYQLCTSCLSSPQ